MEKEKRKDFWIIFLNICLALATIGLLGYIAYKNGYINLENILNTKSEQVEEETDKTDTLTEEETKKEEEKEPLETYEGDVVKASIPQEWEIIEYLDGKGTDMLPTYTSYKGLTGLEVFHKEDLILELKAAWGVGFVGCPKVYVFSDTSSEYIEEVEAMNAELSSKAEIVDYSNVTYTEIIWFGKYFRRVKTNLFFDNDITTKSFDSPCQTAAISFPVLSFTTGDGETANAYFYTISETATTEQLKMLDKILNSMDLK